MLRRIEEGDPGAAPGTRWDSWALYTKNDRLAVDFVGRHETLVEDLQNVCDRVGIPFDETLITREKSNQVRDLETYYEPGDRERVERIFAREIQTFGYVFR